MRSRLKRARIEQIDKRMDGISEQAGLRELAAKEQESKAKLIKARQGQSKDNPNKKSKP